MSPHVAFTFGCRSAKISRSRLSWPKTTRQGGMPWRHAALPSTFLVISTCLESRPVQALEHEIKELIISSLSLEDITPEDIDPTAPLFVEGLGLDSIDALELGLALQKKYGVSLSADSEETRRHFSSVRALGEFVAARQS
ncbi:Putative acyl carrier protein (ACP) (modular protein) [Stenotrophomonas maltophilia]|nr:Putative acyl carrier protein (ACP) (modular protein) [Stenotrophomonas maltophilia]